MYIRRKCFSLDDIYNEEIQEIGNERARDSRRASARLGASTMRLLGGRGPLDAALGASIGTLVGGKKLAAQQQAQAKARQERLKNMTPEEKQAYVDKINREEDRRLQREQVRQQRRVIRRMMFRGF